MHMGNISGISGNGYQDYGRFASGKAINSAADGASELTMIQKQESQSRGYDAGAENIGSAQDMLKVADGALGSITDYLQRIRELAVKASNTAVLSTEDIQSIQKEVDQMKQGIADVAETTEFNGNKLLDGSKKDFQIATGADGSMNRISMGAATLEALGIKDFDVTKDFDLDDIDKAIDKVSSLRSDAGAKSNALDYAYNSNRQASFDSVSARSRVEDLDFAEAVTEKKKKETLQEYALFMQKKKMEDEAIKVRNFFA